ncbi:MAG: DUF4124 domain-containing protein [Gammaproteobacteria bacterium]|nr:DUF4124 domain-containing protein [Gammaproteobacteria bacterium]
MTGTAFKRILITAGLACGLLALPFTAGAAEVNKCVDANGKVTYSSQPCPKDSQAERLKLRTRGASQPQAEGDADDSAGGAPGSMQELDARIAAEEDPVLKAQLQITRQKCELAKTQMQRYEEAPYLVRKNDDGTQERLSDEEAAAEKAKVRQFLAQECR